jgi:hypothetical protein
MVKKSKIHRYWASIPPWIFIGAAVVLIPIIAFMTVIGKRCGFNKVL